MAVHVISYDHNKQKNYPALYEAIKGISGTWCHPVDSTWYVKSDFTAVQIRDHLAQFIDSDDVLIVSVVGATAWTSTLSPKVGQWLLSHI